MFTAESEAVLQCFVRARGKNKDTPSDTLSIPICSKSRPRPHIPFPLPFLSSFPLFPSFPLPFLSSFPLFLSSLPFLSSFPFPFLTQICSFSSYIDIVQSNVCINRNPPKESNEDHGFWLWRITCCSFLSCRTMQLLLLKGMMHWTETDAEEWGISVADFSDNPRIIFFWMA